MPPRASPMRHVFQLYSHAGKDKGYQRKCIVCGVHASYFCVACGLKCSVHPESTRGGGRFDCLKRHREEPSFDFAAAARETRRRER